MAKAKASKDAVKRVTPKFVWRVYADERNGGLVDIKPGVYAVANALTNPAMRLAFCSENVVMQGQYAYFCRIAATPVISIPEDLREYDMIYDMSDGSAHLWFYDKNGREARGKLLGYSEDEQIAYIQTDAGYVVPADTWWYKKS